MKERFEQLWVNCFSPQKPTPIIVALDSYIEELTKIESDVNELQEIIDEATALRKMYLHYKEWYKGYCIARNKKVAKSKETKQIIELKTHLQKELENAHPELFMQVETRLKTISSFNEKIWRDGCSPTKAIIRLKDLIGFRIIIDDSFVAEHVVDCYYVAQTVKQAMEKVGIKQVNAGKVKIGNKDEEDLRDRFENNNEMVYVPTLSQIPSDLDFLLLAKDYIYNPKKNLYQGLHLTFSKPDDEDFFEVQIKTASMFDYCEHHAAAHYLYKLLSTDNSKESKNLTRFNNLSGFRTLDGEQFVDFSGFLTPITV